jgi:hypothetical protein
MMTETSALIQYDLACRALAQARSVDEVKDIRNKSDAMRHYARQAKNKDLEIQAAEIRILAERRLGQMLREQKLTKENWIKAARKEFYPVDREVCHVCNRYKSLTHAHHITPLSIQFERGYEVADQRYVWLCPTHHNAVHILWLFSVESTASLAIDLPEDEWKAVYAIFESGLTDGK